MPPFLPARRAGKRRLAPVQADQRQWRGDFPQAFVHAAVLETAVRLSSAAAD
jgi:hypothetical protein